jgi:hypothetical protein
MTRTVTLPLEWRKNEDGFDELYVGPLSFGWVIYDRPGRYIVELDFHTTLEHYYPTREAAMAALEEAVMALGVKDA